mgnify:CR=1 FL=1
MGIERTRRQHDKGFGGRRENGSAPMPGSVPGCEKAGLQDPQTSTGTETENTGSVAPEKATCQETGVD